MARWIGRVFGNPIATSDNIIGQKGIFDISDRLYFLTQITATGGTTFTPGDGYVYHVFTGSANFEITSGTDNVEAFIVAGGGGGGAGRAAGGGGAGGMRVISGIQRGPGTYPVVVGGGGAAMPYWPGYPLGAPRPTGGKGGDSSVFGFTSSGGGTHYGNPSPTAPINGGSGSGGNANGYGQGTGNSPPVTPPQGNPGGVGAYTYPGPEPSFNCGGGGGAGAAGSNANNIPGFRGPGGVGKSSLSFSPVWNVPASYGTPGPTPGRWFAGGGGGAGGTFAGTPPGGVGGAGGGGSAPAGAATANTGGGGGGGYYYLDQNYGGGSGGSGIVIVRYLA
jgi:hypothetical protein